MLLAISAIIRISTSIDHHIIAEKVVIEQASADAKYRLF